MRGEVRRSAGRLSLLAVLAALVLSMITLVSPHATADPAGADGEQPLLSEFGSCLAGGSPGSIVLLMDQSGSLARTDPENARIEAAEFLVERLAGFSEMSGYELEVRVAGFAATYGTPGDWTALSSDGMSEINRQIGDVGHDLRSHDTDYWMALESARQDLADRESSCSAIFLFSDGEYDIDPRESRQSRTDLGESKPYAPGISLTDERGAKAAVSAGEEDICRPAGVADQLRSSGITLIGVGLTSSEPDFSFLRSVTEGGGAESAERSGVDQCGDVADPQGAFFEADDLDSLLLAFDAMSSPGDSLDSSTLDICQGERCAAGEVSFVLDRALGSVRILAAADVDGLDAYIVPPGVAEASSFPSGTLGETVEQGGMRVTWLTSRTVEIEMSAEDVPEWDGTWRVGFVDPSAQSAGEKIAVNLHLSSPLVLVWQQLDETELRQGTDSEQVQMALLDRTDGTVVDPDELGGNISADVTLTDASGTDHQVYTTLDKAELSAPVTVTVPEGAALGEGRMVTSLQITTAPPLVDGEQSGEGTALQPALLASTVTVQPPQNFPSVGTRVEFGLLEEQTSATASLALIGPGCVWLDTGSSSILGAPSEAGAVEVTSSASSEQDCVRLEEGAEGMLPLDLTTEDHANGAVQGTITVMIMPEDDPSAAQPVTVPFDADLRRPLDATTAWTAFALALALGIGLPLVGLYLLTWATARIPRGTLVSGSTRVQLPEGGGRTEIDLARSALTLTSLPTARRSVPVAGRMLRSRISPLPSEAPWVELDDSSPSVSGAIPGSRRGRARLPLGVRGNWVAVPDRHDPSQATLIVLLGSEDQAALDSVLEDARLRLSDRVRSLGAAVSADKPSGDRAPSARGPERTTPDAASPSGWGSSSEIAPGRGTTGGAPTSWGSAGRGAADGPARQDPPAAPRPDEPGSSSGSSAPGWGSSGPRSRGPESPWGRR